MFSLIVIYLFLLGNSLVRTQSENKTIDELINELFPPPSTGECVCVKHFLCRNNRTIIDNGEFLVDLRIKEPSCESYLQTCCDPPNITDDPVSAATSRPRAKGCGRHNPNGVAFNITGNLDNESQFGEFPWMVAILNANRKYQCGGALINSEAVITAAHCVSHKDEEYVVRVGEWDSQTENEFYPFQDRDVETIIIHPKYSSSTVINDIAILILSKPVEITEHVDVICLPPQDANIENTRCLASGWGKDAFGKDGKYQVILKKADLPIVSRNKCQEKLRKTRLGRYFKLHESFLCAGGEDGKDMCTGDGGSPLVCPIPGHEGQYYHVGIVSWGIGCGKDQIPGVYVNVAKFRKWIDEQMSNHNLEKTYIY